MPPPATQSPTGQQNVRRQFNLRTLFEATTGVCILLPALQYTHQEAARTARDVLILSSVLIITGCCQLVACWLFVKRCPLSRPGSFLGILFCMSAFDGFLTGVLTELGRTGVQFALSQLSFVPMTLAASLFGLLDTCMISVLLLLPAACASFLLTLLKRQPRYSIHGALLGILTAPFILPLAGLLGVPAPQMFSGRVLHLMLANIYGGYFGGRLIERRQQAREDRDR